MSKDDKGTVTLNPKYAHKYTLIFLHGLEATGSALFPMFADQG